MDTYPKKQLGARRRLGICCTDTVDEAMQGGSEISPHIPFGKAFLYVCTSFSCGQLMTFNMPSYNHITPSQVN